MNRIHRSWHPHTLVLYSALSSKSPPAYDHLRNNTLAHDTWKNSFSFAAAAFNMSRLAIADLDFREQRESKSHLSHYRDSDRITAVADRSSSCERRRTRSPRPVCSASWKFGVACEGFAVMRTRIRSPRGPKAIIRPLDPSHPQSWDNLDNEDIWLELARAIGRQLARDEKDGLGQPIEERDGDTVTKKEGRDIRPLLERHAKSDLD